jgi:hypothetical protein
MVTERKAGQGKRGGEGQQFQNVMIGWLKKRFSARWVSILLFVQVGVKIHM